MSSSRTYTRILLRSLAIGSTAAVFLVTGDLLRHAGIIFNPVLWASLQVIAAFLSFSIAANVLVRFLGAGDRASLILGSGFALSGLIQLIGILAFYYQWSMRTQQASLSSLAWMIGETLVALLLLAAFPVDESMPWPRQPKRVVLAVMTVVLAAGWPRLGSTFLALPLQLAIRPGSIIPRPGDLVPAAFFMGAAVVLYRCSAANRSAFDWRHGWWWSRCSTAFCHFIAAESAQPLDLLPEMAALAISTVSYVLSCWARLWWITYACSSEVQDRARRDSLTGLANYRSLVDVVQAELERSGRTARSFSLLLMDLDGFKQINDRNGHLAGNRVLCRVAEVLRLYCRSVDTAARYGGDEFALVLPETDETAARQVALRIERHLDSEVVHSEAGT